MPLSEPLLEELNLDDMIKELKFGKFHIKLTLILFLNSFNQASQVPALGLILSSLTNEYNLNSIEKSIVGSMEYLGFFIASLTISFFADNYGRKKTILNGLLTWTCAQFLAILSPNIYILCLFRCIISICFMLVVLSGYSIIAEMMDSKMRGICMNSIAIVCGLGHIFTINLAGFFFDSLEKGDWRKYFFCLGVLLIFTYLINYFFLDESIRYNLFQGSKENAFKTIKKIGEENLNDKDYFNEQKKERLLIWFEKFNNQVNEKLNSGTDKNSFFMLFKGAYKSLTIKLFYIWFVIVSTTFGIEFLMPFYFEKVYGDSLSSSNSLKYLTLVNICTIPLMVLIVISVEMKYFGRKKTLGILFFFIAFGSFFIFFNVRPFALWIILIKFSYQGNFLLLFLYTNELYPTYMRMNAVGKCSAIGRVGAMIMPWIEIYCLEIYLFLPFFIFFTINLLASAIIFQIPYETKDEKIERILEEK